MITSHTNNYWSVDKHRILMYGPFIPLYAALQCILSLFIINVLCTCKLCFRLKTTPVVCFWSPRPPKWPGKGRRAKTRNKIHTFPLAQWVSLRPVDVLQQDICWTKDAQQYQGVTTLGFFIIFAQTFPRKWLYFAVSKIKTVINLGFPLGIPCLAKLLGCARLTEAKNCC